MANDDKIKNNGQTYKSSVSLHALYNKHKSDGMKNGRWKKKKKKKKERERD